MQKLDLQGLNAAQYLEWREKQYDLRVRVDVFGKDSDHTPLVRGALTYIASENRTKNLNYLGTAPREAIAQQIAFAVGPSGPNYEYLYGLAQALEQVLPPVLSIIQASACPWQSKQHVWSQHGILPSAAGCQN